MLMEQTSLRERAWQVMLVLDTFSVRDVAQQAQVPKTNVSNFVQQLLRKNRLEKVSTERPYKFKVADIKGVTFGKGRALTTKSKLPPNRPRQKMWASIRVLRRLQITDIMMATDSKRSTASKFINRLYKLVTYDV